MANDAVVELDQTLLRLVAATRAHPKHEAWVRWGDVEIDLIIRPDWTSLRVWRQDAAPAESDWRRILAAWPYPVDCLLVPTLHQPGQAFCVATAWPSPVIDQVEF